MTLIARNNYTHWMWSSMWFKNNKGIATIRWEELRRDLSFSVGVVLGISSDGIFGEGKPLVQNCGAMLSGILEWDGTSEAAWGFDAEDLFGVFLKDGKLRVVIYRLVPDMDTAALLVKAVNEEGMTREAFMNEATSLTSVMQVWNDHYMDGVRRLFTDRVVPRLLRDMNYSCVTDYPQGLDKADRFGAIVVEHLFPALFEDAKQDVKRLTELSILLNDAVAVTYCTGETEMVYLYDKLWRKVDEYASDHLSEEEYKYYYHVTD